jgi:hypothetical protein
MDSTLSFGSCGLMTIERYGENVIQTHQAMPLDEAEHEAEFGSTAVDGNGNQDLQSNWRLGGTLALPLSPNFSLKLFASTGVYARTGNNCDLIGILAQYRWGAGL